MCPQQPPNLFRGQQLALLGRYRGAGEATLTLTGDFLGKRETLTARLDFPETNADNPELERMWAWRKVDGLMHQIRERGESAGAKQQIIDLGTQYSIVTPYTAFLVLENEAAYQRFSIERRNLRRVENERSAAERQRSAGPAPTSGGQASWSGGNRSGGGGAVEWLFLASAGLMVGGKLVGRGGPRRP